MDKDMNCPDFGLAHGARCRLWSRSSGRAGVWEARISVQNGRKARISVQNGRKARISVQNGTTAACSRLPFLEAFT